MKVGVLGGTFDPVHSAHIYCAQRACDALGLDKVVFVPAARPPFKLDKELADFPHRLKMCELATRDFDNFEVSDIEGRREGISYTIDTVRELLAGKYSGAKIYFIIGSDAFSAFQEWRESAKLAKLVDFAVLMRSDDEMESVADTAKRTGAKVHFVNGERMDISSSDIRNAFSEGRPPKELLPEAVFDYIEKEGLYSD